MTEEEYFRKTYPDDCYGDKPLSPHWDFFQEGVEFGERESEKKIAELEKENAGIHQKIINLKKENVELEEWKEQTIKARGRDYMDWSRMKDDWNKMNDQLTKAKELLSHWANSYGYIDVTLCNQTDQFLQSKVEK